MGDASEEVVVKKGRGRPAGSGKKAPKPAYVPTGKPRGRPPGKKVEKRGAHLRVPEHLKVGKKDNVPTDKPQGQSKEVNEAKTEEATKPRGRPKKMEAPKTEKADKSD